MLIFEYNQIPEGLDVTTYDLKPSYMAPINANVLLIELMRHP